MTQPFAVSPGTDVQQAIFTILRADATLDALLARAKNVTPAAPAIVDGPAEGQAYPYVTIGDHLSISANDLTSFGREITETLHVWTQTRSMVPGQTIASRIVALLDHRNAAMDAVLVPLGHRCVRIEHEFDQALRDPDPQIRHHVLRFRVETAQLD